MDKWDKLIGEARAGSSQAKLEILEDLKPLVISSINNYYKKDKSYDDLIQDGNVVILQAIIDFDFTREVHFLAYIKSKLTYYYLNKSREKDYLSLNERIGEDGQEFIDLVESDEVDIVDRLINMEKYGFLYRGYESLSKREKQVIGLYYFKAYRLKEIARELGLAFRTVVNTKANGERHLREYISSLKEN